MKRRNVHASAIMAVVLALHAWLLAPPAAAQDLCQPIATGKECFVSPTGDDANPGTEAAPFATVGRGLEELGSGDVLSLREGTYVQQTPLSVKGLQGTADDPIVIRSFPGEHASIDGMADGIDWIPATDPGAHPNEYVSVQTFTGQVRGAFDAPEPYTRLVKYSNVNDFRADNETYEKIPCANAPPDACGDDDARPGPDVVLDCTLDDGTPCRYPWVYMGPGIWIDPSVSASNPMPVHVRLSPTHNGIPELEDYAGPTDPNDVALAISAKDAPTLSISGSTHVRFEDLSVRYGGEPTISLQGSATTNITFDHVRILASSFGVRMGSTSDVTFEHCEFDGGNPPWIFRSDIKISYTYVDDDGSEVENRGANNTVDDLLVPNGADVRLTIRNCEFVNGHDFGVSGIDVDFHHNWVDNMDDEGPNIPGSQASDVRLHENVITATLDAFSLAVTPSPGSFHIYRNLVDLRTPTAGFRPRHPGDTDVWRHGNPFKDSASADTEYSVFQNTFLVYGAQNQATYTHYSGPSATLPRRFFNNIFVAVNPTPEDDRALAFLPAPTANAEADGNDYYKIGSADAPLLRFLGYTLPDGTEPPAGTFDCIDGCDDPLIGSDLFEQSTAQYPPGYEARGSDVDPQFLQIDADGEPIDTDDLRLCEDSPLRGAGAALPDDLQALDADVVPPSDAPDVGAYPFDAAPLAVGVDGRRVFPQ